jgi:hypothetical protein
MTVNSTPDNYKGFWSHTYGKEIQLKIARISTRLEILKKEIAAAEDDFFQLFSYLQGIDIREFTNTKPWEKTPLDRIVCLGKKTIGDDDGGGSEGDCS